MMINILFLPHNEAHSHLPTDLRQTIKSTQTITIRITVPYHLVIDLSNLHMLLFVVNIPIERCYGNQNVIIRAFFRVFEHTFETLLSHTVNNMLSKNVCWVHLLTDAVKECFWNFCNKAIRNTE